ncbi:MAG: MetQ/NlpA family ABC transporter substrate-binding protein [Bacilli bacterium]|nr:MetQ/NlpA family ABC transporter substrate-binding protein [Bacilli bacterium]
MKKLLLSLFAFVLLFCLTACGDDEKTIVVGATPSPHAEILNSEAVQSYIESKGYKLEVKVYQDYVTPNKALNDGGIDANYFQHIPYLEEEIATKGYKLSTAAKIHNEPLNLYGKTPKTDWSNTKVYVINDASNVERAFKLLVAEGLLSSYSVENFNAQHPVYESEIGVTIECIEAGLLAKKVDEGSYAVIPGNYALTAWGATKAASYKVFGESTDVAYPNIIAVRTEDLNNEKIKVLVEALGQVAVKEFIENTYGPTVNYVFESLLK